jgi:hypothetical protein
VYHASGSHLAEWAQGALDARIPAVLATHADVIEASFTSSSCDRIPPQSVDLVQLWLRGLGGSRCNTTNGSRCAMQKVLKFGCEATKGKLEVLPTNIMQGSGHLSVIMPTSNV